jgi:hypothetical protein
MATVEMPAMVTDKMTASQVATVVEDGAEAAVEDDDKSMDSAPDYRNWNSEAAVAADDVCSSQSAQLVLKAPKNYHRNRNSMVTDKMTASQVATVMEDGAEAAVEDDDKSMDSSPDYRNWNSEAAVAADDCCMLQTTCSAAGDMEANLAAKEVNLAVDVKIQENCSQGKKDN